MSLCRCVRSDGRKAALRGPTFPKPPCSLRPYLNKNMKNKFSTRPPNHFQALSKSTRNSFLNYRCVGSVINQLDCSTQYTFITCYPYICILNLVFANANICSEHRNEVNPIDPPSIYYLIEANWFT